MEDFYAKGYDLGYGKKPILIGELPSDICDFLSFSNGYDNGLRRRNISDEIDREIDEDYRSFGF